MINIKLFKDYGLKGYTLLEGFPGAGLVGSMACSYIIEKFGMDYIGYIESDFFPPISTIHNGVPMFPARIYKDDGAKMIIIIAEFTIPSNVIYPLSSEILAFVRKYGISRIVSISGMPSVKPTPALYISSPDPAIIKKASSVGIKPIAEGVIAGISAILITNAVQYRIPMVNLLVEVNPQVLDPKYAEIAIGGLNKLLNTNIDLKDLEEEAKEVEARIKSLMKKVKETHTATENAAEATGPSMYA